MLVCIFVRILHNNAWKIPLVFVYNIEHHDMISEFYALYWFRLQLIEFLRLRLDRVVAKMSKDVVNCMDFLCKYLFTFFIYKTPGHKCVRKRNFWVAAMMAYLNTESVINWILQIKLCLFKPWTDWTLITRNANQKSWRKSKSTWFMFCRISFLVHS